MTRISAIVFLLGRESRKYTSKENTSCFEFVIKTYVTSNFIFYNSDWVRKLQTLVMNKLIL